MARAASNTGRARSPGRRSCSRAKRRRAPLLLALAALFLPAPAAAEGARPGAAAPARGWLQVSGSHRLRYETLDGQFRAGGAGSDQLLSLRTTFLARADFDRIALVAEIWDVRAYLGDEGTPLDPGLVNAAELVQANMRVRADGLFGASSRTEFIGGRQTIDVGSRRLVERNRFRMTTNSFTGISAQTDLADGDQLILFYVLPQRILPNSPAALLDNEIKVDKESFDQRFWGAFYSTKSLIPGTTAEIYAFGLKERDDADFRSRNRDILTAGGRFVRAPQKGRADFEIEGAWQTGRARASAAPGDLDDLDVRANFLHAEAGRTFDAPGSPRLAVEFDYASGDKSPNDGRYNRFDQLFGPRRRDLGPLGLHGEIDRANLIAPGARLSIRPDPHIDVFAHYLAAFLDERRDFFGITGVRDPAGASGRFGAHQVEGAVRVNALPGAARFEIGAAHVVNGHFLRAAPAATGEGNTSYLYAELELFF